MVMLPGSAAWSPALSVTLMVNVGVLAAAMWVVRGRVLHFATFLRVCIIAGCTPRMP
jgi:hypothetical protein